MSCGVQEQLNVEEKVRLYSDSNCYGIVLSVDYGTYNSPKDIPNYEMSGFNVNGIKSIYVPKNCVVKLYDNSKTPAVLAFVYNKKGIYNPAIVLKNIQLIIERKQSWDRFRLQCASGIGVTNEDCGIYYNNKDVGDLIIPTFCSADGMNKKDSLCECHLSEVPNAGCFNSKCINSGYQSKAVRELRSQGCPDYMDCKTFINLSDDAKNNTLNNVTLNQNCSQANNTQTQTNNTSSENNTETTTITNQFNKMMDENPDFVYYAIGIILLIIVIVIIVLLTKGGNKNPQQPYQQQMPVYNIPQMPQQQLPQQTPVYSVPQQQYQFQQINPQGQMHV